MTFFDYMSKKTGKVQPTSSDLSGNWLAKHDAIHHHGHYDPVTMSCSLRDNEKKAQQSDSLLPASPKKEWKPFEPDPKKTVVQNFADIAAYWHERAGNFRKGQAHEPYIVHPRKVADVLRRWGFDDTKNPVTMSVAYGHDLIEDAKAPKDDIIRVGGDKGRAIYGGIKMLSFEPNPLWMTRKEMDDGKQAYIENIAKTAPLGVLAVKMADRLCNTMDFVKAKNPWAHEYLRLGECLFKRLDEFPNKDVIEKTLNAVRERVSRLPEYKPVRKEASPVKDPATGKTIYPEVRKRRPL